MPTSDDATADPIRIERHGDGFRLRTVQWVPADLETVFEFFSRAENLGTITPPDLRWRIETPGTIDMGPGSTIDYHIRVRGLPVRWRTVIARWDPPHAFVDEALRSPYRRWHHEHRFRPLDGGVEMTDEVDYALPVGGPIGRLAHRWLVAPDLRRIFGYRRRRIAERFGDAGPRVAPDRSGARSTASTAGVT